MYRARSRVPGIVPVQQGSCELSLGHWCLSFGESLNDSLILGRANNKMVEDFPSPILTFRDPTLEFGNVVCILSGNDKGDIIPD